MRLSANQIWCGSTVALWYNLGTLFVIGISQSKNACLLMENVSVVYLKIKLIGWTITF